MAILQERFVSELSIRGYRPRTIRNYVSAMNSFCKHLGKPPLKVVYEDALGYLTMLKHVRHYTPRTYNIHLYALKKFYELVAPHIRVMERFSRSKVNNAVPEVLSPAEIKTIIDAQVKTKPRALLALLYATGLRLQEAANLCIRDIDSQRHVVLVKHGKADKDRFTLLPDSLLVILREYYKEHRPTHFLFEGRTPGKALHPRALEDMFSKAIKRSGCIKRVYPHLFRHCFATHLLESGVALTTVQKLLGHKNLKTTALYTHVAVNEFHTIPNPLDNCLRGGDDEK